jgi:hypothetical protein
VKQSYKNISVHSKPLGKQGDIGDLPCNSSPTYSHLDSPVKKNQNLCQPLENSSHQLQGLKYQKNCLGHSVICLKKVKYQNFVLTS